MALGDCSRAGSAAALRTHFGGDQECSGPLEYLRNDFLELAWQAQQRQMRGTRAHDSIAAGAPRSAFISSSCSQHSLPAARLQEGGREERRNPGAAAASCRQEQPRPSQQGKALLLFPASGIASMALNLCLDQDCCSLLLPGS